MRRSLGETQVGLSTRYAIGFMVGISAAMLAVYGSFLYAGTVHGSGPVGQIYETTLRNIIRALGVLYTVGLTAVAGLVIRDLPWSLSDHLRGGGA